MHSSTWKKFEGRVAAILGGRRRGADYGGADGGKSDVADVPGLACEVKLLSRPTYKSILDACRQAERAAAPGELALAVVKRKYVDDVDALVVLRLGTFQAELARLRGACETPEAPESALLARTP